MTAPYKYRFFAPYVKYFISEDWVKFSLDLLGAGEDWNIPIGTSDWPGYSFRNISKNNRSVGI